MMINKDMSIPKAFIFDLDGVIVDTAEYHFLAWKNLAQKLGITIDREFNETLKGVSRGESLERILKLGGLENGYTIDGKEQLANEKNIEYVELIKRITKSDILPNVEELLITLKKMKVRIGLASASKNAYTVIELLGLNEYFDYIADAAKIPNSKPAPDIFLDVMEFFQLNSLECVGVEDAQAGIVAITDAEMFSVGIGDRESLSAANIQFDNTDKLDLDKILKCYDNWYKKSVAKTRRVEYGRCKVNQHMQEVR